MDGIGDDVLAHARLAQKQHRTVERGHLPDHFHDVFQAEILSHYAVAGKAFEFPVKVSIVVGQHFLEPDDFLMLEGVGHGHEERLLERGVQTGVLLGETVVALSQQG